MRRLAGVGLFLIFLLSLGLSGCGGSSSGGVVVATPATVNLAPASISLERGQVFQASTTIKDSKGNVIFTPAPTFSSSNPNITVSTGGLVCAGIWDSLTAPVVCKTTDSNNVPLPVPATANLTATSGGIVSNTVVVSVHLHVDNITLSPTSVNCKSQNTTQMFTATAFSGGVDITSTVGTFSWTLNDVSVGTVDSTGPSTNPVLAANQAIIKAKNPGQANVIAMVSGTNSVAASFTTCSPATISIHTTDTVPVTSFSIAAGSTKQLAADVVDTLGVTITGLNLVWSSSQPAVATVSSAALVTGVAPGVALITASCSPPTCNVGINQPIYSNAVTATVTGTANSTTVYATTTTAPASGAHTDLIPISTSNNTAGTAIALPTDAAINSLLINSAGTKAYLGSSKGLVVVDAAANTLSSTVTNVLGKALVVSPNGQFVVTSDTGAGRVYIFDSVNNTVTVFTIAGATHASFTPDNLKAYIVAGSTLYQYSSVLAIRTVPMTTTANDVAVNSTGQFAYTAGGEASSVAARSTCRNDSTWAPEASVATSASPDLITSASTGNLLAVEGGLSTMNKVTPTITAPGAGNCPPTLSDSLVSKDWNAGCCSIASFTARQIIATPDGSEAFITSDQTVLLGYNIGADTTFSVATSGGASTFTGGALLDSTKVYVGGSDNKVHIIDVAGRTESGTVSLSFTPDLVAVRPH
jgi:hypothetical protein